MEDLTENYIFKCDCSTTLFSAKDLTTKATSTNSKILTKCTILNLKMPGPCPKQNNVPCSCCIVSGTWFKTSSKIFINGNSALIKDSYINCPLGSSIKQAMSTIPTKVNEDKNITISEPSLKVSSNLIKPVNSNGEEPVQSHKNSEQKTKLNNNNPIPDTVDENNIKNDKTKEGIYCEYALCDYNNCEKRDTCEYLKCSHDASSINNDAAKLETNYKNKYRPEYEEYIKKNENNNNSSTEGNWSWAAHHIISGNQIFAKHPYLIKLANYYKYDINNAENCILLPTTHSFEGRQGLTKQANGYVAMDLMKQQWHVGGHAYTLESETIDAINKYLEKTSSSNIEFYRNYVEAVEHEINILESKYKKMACRKNNYDEKKERFIENMNKISYNVKRKLLDFEVGYKKSYPFYVSKEACKFAFDVPKRKKFIILYIKEKYKKTFIYAVKLKVTRFQKDDYKVMFTDSDEYKITDSESFINFAENVKYFINLTNGEYTLPWTTDINREYVMNDILVQSSITDYCNDNEQKIISFIEGRENGEMNYDSSVKIIKDRLNNKLED